MPPESPCDELSATEARLQAEMTLILYRANGVGLIANVVLGMVLVAGVWSYFPPTLTLGWFTLVLIVSSARLSLNAAFFASERHPAEMPRWRSAFLVGVTLAALLWGGAAWIFLSTSALVPRSLVVFIIAGVSAGAVRALASDRDCYRVFVFCTLGPLVARCLLFEEPGSWTLAASGITYAFFLINMARLQEQDLHHLHRLDVEKEGLVRTLRQGKARAEAANLAKGHLLTAIGREIRGPLNGLIDIVQAMRERSASPEQRGAAAGACAAAERVAHLLDDALDVARVSVAPGTGPAAPFHPAAVLRSVLELSCAAGATRHLELFMHVPPSVPPEVTGDAPKLRQALLLILEHVLPRTEQGHVEVAAAVPRPPASNVALMHFYVRDTSRGLDAPALSLLRQRLATGTTPSGVPAEPAEALQAAQLLLRQMGGTLHVGSDRGMGTSYWFVLPLPLPVPAAPAFPPAG